MPFKTPLVALLALALTACATVKGEHTKALHALEGQPVSVLKALYGNPLVMGDELQFDTGHAVGVNAGLSVSTVTGYAGGSPIYGTVTTPVVYGTYDSYCFLRVRVDAQGVITAVGLSGYADQCHQSLKPLYRAAP